MVTRTRKQKRGGALLGEGAHGKAYNVGRTPRNTESLYKLFKQTPYKAIHLQTLEQEDPVELTTSQDMDDFITFLEHTKHLIGKVVKAPQFWQKKSQEREFREELDVNKTVVKAFGSKSEKFLTIQPVKGFRHYSIVGCIGIPKKTSAPLYVIFGHKCSPTYAVHLDQFVLDITETLVELESHGLRHNDIKPTNVVRCDDRYKLIDWGATTTDKKATRGGGVPMSSPMRYYVGGLPSYLARTFPYIGVEYEYNDWFNTNHYQDLFNKIDKEFLEILEKPSDRATLFQRYGPSSDLYQLGITVALLMYKHDLNTPKYQRVMERLTSLAHPFRSAKEALPWIRKTLHGKN
jgi:serine/threonine protein kinase